MAFTKKFNQMKELIRLRLRLLLNGECTFEETVSGLYQDAVFSPTFNFKNFVVGFAVGNVVGLLVLNYLIQNK